MTAEEQNSYEPDLHRLIRRLEAVEAAHAECFLCAKDITDGSYTDEHVIPCWAQRAYDLWDQHLILLNGTGLPYRKLTVPCCEDCNRNRLGPLEESLSQAVRGGVGAVRALPRDNLLLWLGKIFFGVLYKEIFLLLDRSDPAGATIVTPAFLRELRSQRLLLQQVRDAVRLVDFHSGSFFAFPAQKPPQKQRQWDMCDSVAGQVIGCRAGDVALFACLGDGGAQQLLESDFADFAEMPLHPLQFRELCAVLVYRASLATRVPKYVAIGGPPHQIHQMPLGGLSMKPLFADGDPETYALVLSHYTGVPMEYLFEAPDKVRTYLRGVDGQPLFMDVRTYDSW